jgi:CRP-like cAMP-binding protein
LRSNGDFAPVSSAELAAIQNLKAGELVLPRGSHLRREGATDGDCYTLLEGWAFRFRTLSSGARQILNFMLPGDFIRPPENLQPSAQHGVQLLTRAVLCRFPAHRLTELYRTQPQLGSRVLWLVTHGEALVAENLVSVGQRTALQRVAALLLSLYQRAAHVGLADAAGAVEFPLTQRHMADALGMSLIHTHRSLHMLGKSRLFAIEDSRLIIHDIEALDGIADFPFRPARAQPLL